jgi:uncharacterized membrane protein
VFAHYAYYYWRYLVWPELAFVVVLVVGLATVRRQLAPAQRALPVLGRVFVSATLAAFGAGHLVAAQIIGGMVPTWMPWHVFWAYLVGLALCAAALSILLMREVRWSAPLLGIMFFIFVLSIHVPLVVAHPTDRFAWAVAARDFLFGVGAWALAGTGMAVRHEAVAHWLIASCRVVYGVVLGFFGIEQLMHPDFVPGIPLEVVTPTSVPARAFWGYLIGAVLVAGGIALLIDRQARAAAIGLAIAVTLVALIMFLPLLSVVTRPSELATADNYLFDTLLFTGNVFLLAAAISAAPNRPGVVVPDLRHTGRTEVTSG